MLRVEFEVSIQNVPTLRPTDETLTNVGMGSYTIVPFVLGGLTAVIWTDTIQTVILIVGSVILSWISEYIWDVLA